MVLHSDPIIEFRLTKYYVDRNSITKNELNGILCDSEYVFVCADETKREATELCSTL